MHAHLPLQCPAIMHCSSSFLHAARPQIQMPLAGLISPTSIACCLGPQSTGEAIRLHCTQKNQKQNQVFPNLCPSPLHELWWFGFFYSCISPSDDLALVTDEHPLLSSVRSSVNPEQFGLVCIHLNAYLYIEVSLLFFFSP